jgi:hypothetical protein
MMLEPSNSIRLLGRNGDKSHTLTGARLNQAMAVTADNGPCFGVAADRLAIIE